MSDIFYDGKSDCIWELELTYCCKTHGTRLWEESIELTGHLRKTTGRISLADQTWHTHTTILTTGPGTP